MVDDRQGRGMAALIEVKGVVQRTLHIHTAQGIARHGGGRLSQYDQFRLLHGLPYAIAAPEGEPPRRRDDPRSAQQLVRDAVPCYPPTIALARRRCSAAQELRRERGEDRRPP